MNRNIRKWSEDELATGRTCRILCGWFVGCFNLATHDVDHMFINAVPTCDDCVALIQEMDNK